MKTTITIIAALAIGCGSPPTEPDPPAPELDVPADHCALDASLLCMCGPIQADPRTCGCYLDIGDVDACRCDGVPFPIQACVPEV